MPYKYKNDWTNYKKDWTVLDGMFLHFVVFTPAILYFLSSITLGPPRLIGTVEGAVKFVPKLAWDIDFVSRHYSQQEANEFALFFANYFAIAIIISVIAFGVRLTKFRHHPYDFAGRGDGRSKKKIYVVLVLAGIMFFYPSFFIEPSEISTFGFRPGYKAVGMSAFFLSMFVMIIYVQAVMWATRNNSKDLQLKENE